MIQLLAATTSSATSIPLGITQEGNWFLQNAWLIPLIPALSFIGILFLVNVYHVEDQNLA